MIDQDLSASSGNSSVVIWTKRTVMVKHAHAELSSFCSTVNIIRGRLRADNQLDSRTKSVYKPEQGRMPALPVDLNDAANRCTR